MKGFELMNKAIIKIDISYDTKDNSFGILKNCINMLVTIHSFVTQIFEVKIWQVNNSPIFKSSITATHNMDTAHSIMILIHISLVQKNLNGNSYVTPKSQLQKILKESLSGSSIQCESNLANCMKLAFNDLSSYFVNKFAKVRTAWALFLNDY